MKGLGIARFQSALAEADETIHPQSSSSSLMPTRVAQGGRLFGQASMTLPVTFGAVE